MLLVVRVLVVILGKAASSVILELCTGLWLDAELLLVLEADGGWQLA